MKLNLTAMLRSLCLFSLMLHFAGVAVRADTDRWTCIGPYSGSILAVAVDPAQPRTIYVGTFGSGVFKSTDGGANWSASNAGLRSSQFPTVEALKIDRLNTNIIFAGTQAGVFKSTDGGSAWSQVKPAPSIDALAIAPSNNNVIYAGANIGDERENMYRSTNGGASWVAMNSGMNELYPSNIAIDPSNSNIMYTAVEDEFYYKSTDGGASWSEKYSGRRDFFAEDLIIDPSNTNTIYAVGGGIFKSTNGGDHWEPITDFIANCLAIDPSRPDILYAGTSAVMMSTNGGETWQPVNDGIQDFGVNDIVIDPANPNLVYAETFTDSIFKREFSLPEIGAAVFTAPKSLIISGRNFGVAPRVIINGSGRSDFLVSSSDTAIQLKGKAKKLKLRAGDNTIQIIGNGVRSNVFILRL